MNYDATGEEEVGAEGEEPKEKDSAPAPPPIDENTGIGGWTVAEKPLYSEKETDPNYKKKQKKKKRKKGEVSSDEDDDNDDTGIDKDEYLADFGFSKLVKAPVQKRHESSDDDDGSRPVVAFKKKKRRDRGNLRKGL